MEEIINAVSKLRIITPKMMINLIRNEGEEVLKALGMLEEGRGFKVVIGNHEIHAFSGDSGDYIIFDESNYCGCMSRYPINISRRKYCPHLIAFKLLKALNKISVLEFDDKDFDWIIRYLKFNIEYEEIE